MATFEFFEHHCFLHCDVPRINTSDGKVTTVNVPWARTSSGFTLLFEAFAMALIEREMPVNRVAEILGVNLSRVWTLFNYWIKKARKVNGHKYTFLKNRQNLSEKKEKELSEMITLYPNLGEAYRLKVLFNDLWEMPNKIAATAFLTQWCNDVDKAKIPAFMAFSKTVRSYWSGIIHFVESHLTNGILEGINSKVQLAKRRARGYRNIKNFINMIYFLCGKLKFDYPQFFAA